MNLFIRTKFLTVMIILSSSLIFAQEPQIINIGNRSAMTLNGEWKYVVDPYQTGYYDYRREVRDQQANPSVSESLFLGYRAQDPSERVEYDFEKSDKI